MLVEHHVVPISVVTEVRHFPKEHAVLDVIQKDNGDITIVVERHSPESTLVVVLFSIHDLIPNYCYRFGPFIDPVYKREICVGLPEGSFGFTMKDPQKKTCGHITAREDFADPLWKEDLSKMLPIVHNKPATYDQVETIRKWIAERLKEKLDSFVGERPAIVVELESVRKMIEAQFRDLAKEPIDKDAPVVVRNVDLFSVFPTQFLPGATGDLSFKSVEVDNKDKDKMNVSFTASNIKGPIILDFTFLQDPKL